MESYDYLTAGRPDLSFESASTRSRSARNLVLPITPNAADNRQRLTRFLGKASAREIVRLMEGGQISGAYKQFTTLPGSGDKSGWDWVLLIGLGDRKGYARHHRLRDRVRSVAAIAARHFRRMNLLDFAICDFVDFGLNPDEAAQVIAEGILLGIFRFERYKSPENRKYKGERSLKSVTLLSDENRDGFEAAFERARIDAFATYFARNLVNTRAADLGPADWAAAAKDIVKRVPGLSIEILDEKRMEKERMYMHLAVGKGSVRPPRVVVLRYRGLPHQRDVWDLTLVGKGVTFDSGGYNLKPTGYIERMYRDMAGGAAVFGAMVAIAQRQLDLNVAAVIPMADNLVSGHAFHPGDIVRSRKGLTVEIVNTDAEGRLLLGDALTYACDVFSPRILVDAATLTGAIRTALGNFVTGLFVHSDEPMAEESLAQFMNAAGHATGEWVWQLPVDDDYKVQLSSTQADLENCETDRMAGAGSITAAVFLKQFIDFDKVQAWAHLDIAATAYMQRTLIYNKSPYQPKDGATGVGVRLFTDLARRLAKAR